VLLLLLYRRTGLNPTKSIRILLLRAS